MARDERDYQDHDNNRGEKRPSRPSHIAYQVREGKDGDAFFNRVGAAFPHKDGEGYNIELDAVPVDGRVTLRTPKERVDDMKDDRKEARDTNRRSSRRSRDDYER